MSKRSSEIKKIRKVLKCKRGEQDIYRAVNVHFTKDDAILIAKALKIDFEKEKFNIDDFLKGINIELEHGSKFKETNITKDDPILTAKIALAHLKEFPDYYERLSELEKEAIEYWSNM